MKLNRNKKGGDFSTGKWLVLLIIYFALFIIVANTVNNMFFQADNQELIIENSEFDFNNLLGNFYCDNPRYFYNAETLEISEYKKVQYDYLNCEESIGVKSENKCSEISGCSWDNVTSGFWFWTTTESASCIGNINASHYNISTTGSISGQVVASHENTELFGAISVCNHPNVIQNKTLCDLFSCTWDKMEVDSEFSSSTSIIDTVKDLFTFRYSFGFENENINIILQLILFYIPLVMFIIVVYFMLPFAH